MTKRPLGLMALLLTSSGLAQAQVPPDAGSLLQQIEKNRPPALPGKSAPQPRPAAPPMEALGGVSVTVKAFRFNGNKLIASSALDQAVAPFLNRPLGFGELQQAAQAVAEAYRAAGWIARVYLPRQEIDNGIVTIEVVEAVFGRARDGGRAPARVGMDRIARYVEAAQPHGAPLRTDAVDRALLLVDDLPGVAASGNLAAGASDYETDLVLKLTDEPFYYADVGVDNTGNRSTGAPRATANVSLNSPFGIGDLGGVNLIHSEGSDYGRLAYSIPVGDGGWRVGASASYLSYRLVADEFAALRAKGDSRTTGLDASYPLLRARLVNLFASFNVDDKRFDNQANGAVSSHYGIRTYSAGLNGNLFDNLGGGGANSANLTVVQGKVDLDGSPNQAADAASAHAAGDFVKLRYGATRQQAITPDLSLYAALSGQAANRNLDSNEKFYLGGSNGVRAYPASEAGGASGQLVNLELRARLPANVTLTGFYDWGHATVNRDNAYKGAALVNALTLKGAGLAVAWIAPFRLNLKASWARRIGGNPNPAANGSDQDGTLRRNRFWLQATQQF